MGIGTVYRLSVVGDLNGYLHVNTFHFRQDADIPGPIVPSRDIAIRWDFIMAGTYLGLFPQLYRIREYNVFVGPGSPENISVPAPAGRIGVGIWGTAILPTQCCAVVTWQTDIAGRRYRGRSYLSSLTESNVTGNFLITSYRDRLQQFADRQIVEFGNDPEWSFVVLSRVASTSNRVISAVARDQVKTQRRRSLLP